MVRRERVELVFLPLSLLLSLVLFHEKIASQSEHRAFSLVSEKTPAVATLVTNVLSHSLTRLISVPV